MWALIALPSTVGALLAMSGRRADAAAPAVAVLTALGGLGLAVAAAFAHPGVTVPFLERLPVRLAVDGLSGLMAVTTTAITLTVLLVAAISGVSGVSAVSAASTAEVAKDRARARFYGLMLLFSGSMLVTVTAVSLPVLLIGWEIMGAVSWALIGFWWREPARVAAANTAFLTTRTADLGLYLAAGAALAGGPSATPAFADLPHATGPWRDVLTAGIIAAALGKSAQLPFSFWLSRAMRGPSPVSALLHSATMVVAGAYLLLRTGPLLQASGWGGTVVAWAGVATAVGLGLVAVAQTDLKQLLAASSCAQIGFMVLAAGSQGLAGGTLQLIAHAAAKSLLFLVAGLWLTALGTKSLPALRGAGRRYRTSAVLFTVAALTLAGLPPLALWAAKDVLLAAALDRDPWLYAAGLAAAGLSAVYCAKALWFVWRPAPGPDESAYDTEQPGTRRIAASTGWPLGALAIGCVVLGVWAFAPLRDRLDRVLGTTGTTGTTGTAMPHGWELAVSGAVAVAAGAGAWAWGGRRSPLPRSLTSLFTDWLHLERWARALFVRPVLLLARGAALFDDRVLDRAVDGTAAGALRAARWTDGFVERAVDGAVTATAAATGSLGRLARRPQTGQLHQYLAQAAGALTVLAVVFALVR